MRFAKSTPSFVTVAVTLLASIIGVSLAWHSSSTAQAAAGAQPEPTTAPPFKSLDHAVQWNSPHSEIKKARFVRITDDQSWKDLWVEHRGERIEYALTEWPIVPNVNFDKYMVVGVFAGERVRCNGYDLEALDEFSDHLRLRYDAMTFQVSTGFGEQYDESQDRGHPFGLFVIPKSEKRIILEENRQGLINAPPKWVETHHIPAL